MLNIALPLRSIAEHAPFWDVWQLARDQTVRAGIDAESVLFGTFSAPFSRKTPSRIVAIWTTAKAPRSPYGSRRAGRSLGKDDHPLVKTRLRALSAPRNGI